MVVFSLHVVFVGLQMASEKNLILVTDLNYEDKYLLTLIQFKKFRII